MGTQKDTEMVDFQRRMLDVGLVYQEADLAYLLQVAKRCSREAGVPMGAASGAMTAGVGAVTVPGVGAIPGWVAGALAGYLTGTVMCTVVRGSMKKELDALVQNK